MEKRNNIDITFFIPCFNEENHVIGAIETVLSAVKKVGCTFEILIFDDNSTDNTVKVTESYLDQNSELPIKLIKRNDQKGLSYNYTDGAFSGKGYYYRLYNGSNVEPEESLVRTLNKMGTADMVIPYIEVDKRNFTRKNLSKIFVVMVNVCSGNSLKYYNGPVIHRRYNAMRWHSDSYGHGYQAEIICRMLVEGMSYVEVGTISDDRKYGKSYAMNLNNFDAVMRTLIKIFILRFRKKYY